MERRLGLGNRVLDTCIQHHGDRMTSFRRWADRWQVSARVASPHVLKPDGGKAKCRAEGVEGVLDQKRIRGEACV